MANRFDGLDFPDDECRAIIVWGLPRATNLQERFLESRMAASAALDERIKSRVTQAIGRCTRGFTDYSVVVMVGDELTGMLFRKETLRAMHVELQAEIDFGIEESKGQTMGGVLENVKIFLQHSAQWDAVDTEILNRRDDLEVLLPPAHGKLQSSAPLEVAFQYDVWNKNYRRATERAENIVALLSGDDVKGYRAFWYYLGATTARRAGFTEKAIQLMDQAGATMVNGAWFEYARESGQQRRDVSALSADENLEWMIQNLEQQLTKFGTGHAKFNRVLGEIRTGLMNPASGKQFEDAHQKLGQLLGFASENSEEDGAPDPWWTANGDVCIVAEDKLGNDPVSISEARQAASHPLWVKSRIKELHSSANVVPVMITDASQLRPNARTFLEGVRHWPLSEFREWAENSLSVVRSLRATFAGPGIPKWREDALAQYRQHRMAPAELVCMLESRNMTDLPDMGEGG